MIFSHSVSKESIIDVFATVSSVSSPIESCTTKSLELHVTEFWVVSSAKTHLPLLIEDAARKITQDEVTSRIIPFWNNIGAKILSVFFFFCRNRRVCKLKSIKIPDWIIEFWIYVRLPIKPFFDLKEAFVNYFATFCPKKWVSWSINTSCSWVQKST